MEPWAEEFRYNGYPTNKAELKWMAENWTTDEIMDEFDIESCSQVSRLLAKHGITKTRVNRKKPGRKADRYY